MSDIPELAFSLDVRGLKAWLEDEGGQPTLHIADDSQHVVIENIAGGSAGDALDGARELTEAARQFAAAIDMASEPAWWTAPEVTMPEQLTRNLGSSHNAAGF